MLVIISQRKCLDLTFIMSREQRDSERISEDVKIMVFIHACILTHCMHTLQSACTHTHTQQIQISVLIAVAAFESRVMMLLLWGGGHVCVSLLSDAWYKRSEEENAGGIWNSLMCIYVCVCVCLCWCVHE